jgi:hypothetical protein
MDLGEGRHGIDIGSSDGGAVLIWGDGVEVHKNAFNKQYTDMGEAGQVAAEKGQEWKSKLGLPCVPQWATMLDTKGPEIRTAMLKYAFSLPRIRNPANPRRPRRWSLSPLPPALSLCMRVYMCVCVCVCVYVTPPLFFSLFVFLGLGGLALQHEMCWWIEVAQQ